MISFSSFSSQVVTKNKHSPIIIAIDYSIRRNVLAFVDQIDPRDFRLKVGKEIFTLFGPPLIRDLQQRGFDVFLDLKFYDIPKTTAYAVSAAAELGVWMINVHASGGVRMMNAAREALMTFGKDAPILIAVTVLTSMESCDLPNFNVMSSVVEHAEKLANLAKNCGLDGVVCSAQEAIRFKNKFGKTFKIVTPGIRLNESESDDQRRIMTPNQALLAGVDYMVIGRPITQSKNPIMTLKAINASLLLI